MTLPRMDLASAGRTLPQSIEFAEIGEASGWRGVWVSETNGMEAVALATAIATRLGSGRVGSAIVPVQTRDPLLLAMAAASIDQVTPGGFVLGLGVSTPIIIEDWHATEWGASPLGLTREAVDLTRRFLAGERVTTDSGRWHYRRAQLLGPPRRKVPIYIAALNDRMLRLAGEIADGVILNFVTVEDLRHAREQVARGAEKAGRSLDDFEYVIYFRATVCDDYEEVRNRYQSELLTYVMAPVYQDMFARQGQREACHAVQELWREKRREEALDAIPEALIRERALIGTRAEIFARLEDYAAAGLDSTMVLPVAIPEAPDYGQECERIIRALGTD